MGVDNDTIWRWERDAAAPQIHHFSKIIEFLGYNPLPAPEDLADALLASRKFHGWSRRKAAKVLGLDESTLARLEQGKSQKPSQETRRKLETFIGKGIF
jgi:transcriptional regulator with XRE-family HTH domain